MGILNVTPDSFYDGGKYYGVDDATAQAARMVEGGADIIDVGGESSRPGSEGIDEEEEVRRLAPVVQALIKEVEVPISIDTRKAGVAERMLDLGAHMINDVSGLSYDEGMTDVVKAYDVPVVIMHMRGTPLDMQEHTDYSDVVAEVRQELMNRVAVAEAAGISRARVLVDPGIGFSKTAEQSVEIIARLDELTATGYPVLLGPSRKSFIGKILGLGPEERLEPTIATCIWGVLKGVKVLRVHDVGPVVRALNMLRGFSARSKGGEVKVS